MTLDEHLAAIIRDAIGGTLTEGLASTVRSAVADVVSTDRHNIKAVSQQIVETRAELSDYASRGEAYGRRVDAVAQRLGDLVTRLERLEYAAQRAADKPYARVRKAEKAKRKKGGQSGRGTTR